MRVGYARISYAALAAILDLPEDTKIVDVWQDFDDRMARVFRIVMTGPAMPETPEGQMSPRVPEVELVMERSRNVKFVEVRG